MRITENMKVCDVLEMGDSMEQVLSSTVFFAQAVREQRRRHSARQRTDTVSILKNCWLI